MPEGIWHFCQSMPSFTRGERMFLNLIMQKKGVQVSLDALATPIVPHRSLLMQTALIMVKMKLDVKEAFLSCS